MDFIHAIRVFSVVDEGVLRLPHARQRLRCVQLLFMNRTAGGAAIKIDKVLSINAIKMFALHRIVGSLSVLLRAAVSSGSVPLRRMLCASRCCMSGRHKCRPYRGCSELLEIIFSLQSYAFECKKERGHCA